MRSELGGQRSEGGGAEPPRATGSHRRIKCPRFSSMPAPAEDAIERFRKRTAQTDDATLYRNLGAGVYGPPGSKRRAIAESALEQRLAERATALQVATWEEPSDLVHRADAAARWARRAAWIALIALAVALFGLARSLGAP